MSGRDDMVMRPTLEEVHGTDAATRGRVSRRIQEQESGRGLFSRLARRRAAERLARRRVGRAGVRNLAGRRTMGMALRSTAGRALAAAGKTGRFMLNPATATGMLGLFAATYAASRMTGATFSEVGQFLNNNLLGDIDDEGRARTMAAEKILSDPNVAAHIGRRGQIDAEVKQAVELMYQAERPQQTGGSQLATAFPAIDDFELYLRAIERGFSKGWDASYGNEAAVRIIEMMSRMKGEGIVPGASK